MKRTNNLANDYLVNTYREIMEDGTYDKDPRPKYSDGVPAFTKFTPHVVQSYDVSKGEFPLLTLRPLAWKSAIKEILWIYQDQTSSLAVLEEKYGIKWWRSWESKDYPGTIGHRYGHTVRKYDLMNRLLTGLREDPYSRRHIINLWQEDDFTFSDGLVPCAFQTIWTVRGEYLDCMLTQRSSDYLVAGHINQLQYVALLLMVARASGLKPGKFTHVIANCHIYDRHFAPGAEMVNRYESLEEEESPQLILREGNTDFYKFTIDDFALKGYNGMEPQLKFDLGI